MSFAYNDFGLVTSLFLLCLSAIFSFSETCLITCNKNKIIRQAELKNKKAQIVLNLLRKKDRMISTVLFGNTLINVLLSSITTNELVSAFGEKCIVLTSLGITFVILVFGEILPKNLAIINPEKSSMRIGYIINLVVKIFYPITFFLQLIVSLFFRIFGFKIDKTKNSFISDVRDLISAYKTDESTNSSSSFDMLSGISMIETLKIGQIMVHRTNTTTFNINNDSLDCIIEKAIESAYSRIPICGDNDEIIGILYVKDLMRYMSETFREARKDPWEEGSLIQKSVGASGGIRVPRNLSEASNVFRDPDADFQTLPIDSLKSLSEQDLPALLPHEVKRKELNKEEFIKLLRKPFFVYENISLTVQLNKFRKERVHLAVVLDEYSVFLGIITLEDIIEKIVGSIYDEYDDSVDDRIEQNAGTNDCIISGDLSLHEAVKAFNLNIPDYEKYTTTAGFIIEKIERIPEKGEEIKIDDYIFIIREVENNKIVSVLVKRI